MERERDSSQIQRRKRRHAVIGDGSTFEMSLIERTKGGPRMQIH